MRVRREPGEYRAALRRVLQGPEDPTAEWLEVTARRRLLATIAGSVLYGGAWTGRLYASSYMGGPRFLNGDLPTAYVAIALAFGGTYVTTIAPFVVSRISYRYRSWRRATLALVIMLASAGADKLFHFQTLPMAIAASFAVAFFGFRQSLRARVSAISIIGIIGLAATLTGWSFVLGLGVLLAVPLVGLADQIQRTRTINLLDTIKRARTRKHVLAGALLALTLGGASFGISEILIHPRTVTPSPFLMRMSLCQGTYPGTCPARVASQANVEVAWLEPWETFPYYSFQLAPRKRTPVLLIFQTLESPAGNMLSVATDPTNRLEPDGNQRSSMKLMGNLVTVTATPIDRSSDPEGEYNYTYLTFDWLRNGVHYQMQDSPGATLVPPRPLTLDEMKAAFNRIKYQPPPS